jgi:branched-chain amino acid transport system ATP-binding protein
MTNGFLAVADLTAAYGPVLAVQNASLLVRRGQIVALLGANGAGKTSLLRTISGMVKPRAGTIVFDGEIISGRDGADIAARGVGHVPEGREIFPFLTVHENLRMGAYLRRAGRDVANDMEKICSQFPILRERAKTMPGSSPEDSSRFSRWRAH